jgi:hypothetical protein
LCQINLLKHRTHNWTASLSHTQSSELPYSQPAHSHAAVNITLQCKYHGSPLPHVMSHWQSCSDVLQFHSWPKMHQFWLQRNMEDVGIYINLLKPIGYGMHQQVEYFNNCTLCPHYIYVFCICLRTNSDLCHLHQKLICFYNRDEKRLERSTDWAFKWSSQRFIF